MSEYKAKFANQRYMTISILGTQWHIIVKNYDEDPYFKKMDCGGYAATLKKIISICDMRTFPNWETSPIDDCEVQMKVLLRHEIIHAFLEESGLSRNSNESDGPWARNEEMVDWIALQGPKIHKVWEEADTL